MNLKSVVAKPHRFIYEPPLLGMQITEIVPEAPLVIRELLGHKPSHDLQDDEKTRI